MQNQKWSASHACFARYLMYVTSGWPWGRIGVWTEGSWSTRLLTSIPTRILPINCIYNYFCHITKKNLFESCKTQRNCSWPLTPYLRLEWWAPRNYCKFEVGGTCRGLKLSLAGAQSAPAKVKLSHSLLPHSVKQQLNQQPGWNVGMVVAATGNP